MVPPYDIPVTRRNSNSAVVVCRVSFGGEGGGAFAPPWLWLAPLGYVETSILHVNQFKAL